MKKTLLVTLALNTLLLASSMKEESGIKNMKKHYDAVMKTVMVSEKMEQGDLDEITNYNYIFIVSLADKNKDLAEAALDYKYATTCSRSLKNIANEIEAFADSEEFERFYALKSGSEEFPEFKAQYNYELRKIKAKCYMKSHRYSS